MKALNFGPAAIVIGEGSLEYLKELGAKKVLIVSGGSSTENKK